MVSIGLENFTCFTAHQSIYENYRRVQIKAHTLAFELTNKIYKRIYIHDKIYLHKLIGFIS